MSEEMQVKAAPRRRVLVGLSAALVVAIATLGWAVVRASTTDLTPSGEITSERDRAAVMTEVARLTTMAMSWRAASSEADIAAVKAVMTPRMRTEYDKTLPAESERAAQAEQEVTVTAVVTPLVTTAEQPAQCTPELCAVGLLSATEKKATALLFINQTASAKGSEKAVVSPTWELVTVVRNGNDWLIDEMVAP